MSTRLNIEELKTFLPRQEAFSKEMIKNYFIEKEGLLTNGSLDVRINRLKSKGIIIAIGRGWYRFNDKKLFEPELSPFFRKISVKLKKEFPFLNFILWSSNWLNDLTTLQMMRNVLIIEVESGSEEAVFRTIKDSYPSKTFLNPKENEWEYYMYENENLIIKAMISESPYSNYHSIKIPRLEKILVDLFCDKSLKAIFVSELFNIFTEACSNFSLNYSTLLSYAGRRGKRIEIWNYIKSLDILEMSTIQMIEK